MTLEAEGSAAAGNPDAAGAAPASGTPESAQTDVWAGLQNADNRSTATAKGWKSPEDAIGSYRELESYLGKVKSESLLKPADDAKPEDWDAFYSKLGRPEKPDAYSFKLPEGLPENLPYDEQSAVKFKNWAHKAGLSPQQAQAVHDEFVKDTAAGLKASSEAAQKAEKDAHEAIAKTWGEPGSEAYKRNLTLADRAIRNLGGTELMEELKGVGALGPNGEARTPRLAAMLAKVGGELYAEDTLYGGPGGGQPNPFSEKSENMTEQGQIIRTNPDHARALIRAAGLDPAKDYGL